MRTHILILAFVLVLIPCSSVRAELNFCNAAPLTINTFVGEPAGGGKWQSRGWWPLNSGECVTVIGGNLSNRYYYAYAETPGRKRIWSGDATFCFNPVGSFTLEQGKCADYATRKLNLVDVGNSKSFTYTFNCPDCLDANVLRAVQLNIPFIEGIANQRAPLSYRTNDWQDIGPFDLQYGVSRWPFRISINGNQISITTRLFYWLELSDTRLFGFRQSRASCGLGEAQRIADITVTAFYGVTPQGKLVSKTRSSLNFLNRCNLTVLDLDVTDYIQNTAQSQLNSLTSTIDNRIGEIDVSRLIKLSDVY